MLNFKNYFEGGLINVWFERFYYGFCFPPVCMEHLWITANNFCIYKFFFFCLQLYWLYRMLLYSIRSQPEQLKNKNKNPVLIEYSYQFMFSDSALFFNIHLATVPQSTGRWASSVHCPFHFQGRNIEYRNKILLRK